MRKVSKSRAEDDVVSSTNGSVLNEENADADLGTPDVDEQESQADADADDEQNNDGSETSKEPAKRGRPPKSKGKKKKSSKGKVEEEEYEVEKVVDSKKIKGKLHYLIRWKGYSADSDTWEPENTLSCPELIEKFKGEKENSKTKEPKSTKKALKRKASKKDTNKTPPKKVKTSWDEKDENAEYEVEKILEVHHKKNGKREFLIHWKGWSTKFDSWEPENHLNCPDLIKRFMDKVDSARTTESRNLRVAPETTNRFTLQDPSSGRRLSKRRGQRQRIRYDNAE